MYRVLWAYLKQQYSSLTAYKSAFCMTLVNVFIRIYAYAMLWMTLYKQNASLFGNIDLNQMLLYSIFSISLSQAFTWWDGPHIYVEENIKNGRIPFSNLIKFNDPFESLCFYVIYSSQWNYKHNCF